MNDITFGQCASTDLDFADDISLLAELLELLVPALQISQEEVTPLGLEVNWHCALSRALTSLHLWARCPTCGIICLPRSYDSLVL